MAATVSSVWAKPGAWALDSEEHEDELKQQQIQAQTQTRQPDPPASDFPSLSAAVTTKPKKKGKGQTLSLAEFSSYSAPKPAVYSAARTHDEPLVLPTGPRERTAEELERGGRLGGGFRNYGDRDRDSNSRVRVSERGERERDSNRGERDMGPSRADEVDDWSKGKKFGSGSGMSGSFGSGSERGGERREKVGFFNSSRADEVDNWASGKSFTASTEAPRRERRMGFESSYSNGAGPDSDTWGRRERREERGPVMADSDTWGRRERVERPAGGGADSETWGRRENGNVNANGNGVSNGSRPRLNLQPRSLPVVVNNGNDGGKGQSLSVTPTEGVKKGANPFGEARPREEVLAEKGQDWKEIDEKLEAVKIKDKEVGEKSEGFGKRRGFGIGRGGENGGVEKSWRKPESNGDAVVAATPAASSAETTEESAEVTEEEAGSTEKVAEEN